MVAPAFVGRERELARLDTFLEQAVAGHGQVALVAGEVGTGKTALLQEFARRAQVEQDALVVASGNCNAFTGLGDPYLPFREILGQLAGDPEAQAAQGLTSAENAKRIQALLARSLQILVDVGPELVNTLLPGSLLVGKIAQAVLHKTGVLEKLGRDKAKGAQAVTLEGQSRLIEQYSSFVRQLAAEQPLLIILDDLQWIDIASSTLLFHLGRRISTAPVLIVGAYRSDEVALGREGERHPLEKVLSEFQRYFGEIELDLAQTIAAEGQSFVNAFVGTQPNRLDMEFRRALYAHTQGHPLFTVELLRSLQERGDLIRDQQNRWIVSTTLDWEAMPARVEGVIEERLARLTEELRETLTIGSVMGDDFYAQVIAQVQRLPEREVIRNLARELDKRHHLVREQGEIKVGSHFLSLYRFADVLVQQFLYHELSAGERRLLHGDVAVALETLVAGHTDASAVQLARHYSEAGDGAKAAEYEIQAGDASARAFAYPEARLHYRRALEMLPSLAQTDALLRTWIDTTIKYAEVALSSDAPSQLLTRLKDAEALFEHLPAPADVADRTRRVYLHRQLGYLHNFVNDYAASLAYLQPLLEDTQAIGNEELYMEVAGLLGSVYASRGYFVQALPLLSPTVTYFEKRSTWRNWANSATDLSITLAALGQCTEGIAMAQKCVRLGQEAHDYMTIAPSYGYLTAIYVMIGEDNLAIEANRAFTQAAEKGGELFPRIIAHVFQGLARSRRGEHDLARESMQQAQQLIELWRETPRFFMLPAVSAEIALNAGDYAEAIVQAQHVLANIPEHPWAHGLVQRTWAQALAASDPGAWEEAEEHFAASLAEFALGDVRIEAAHTHVAWGRLLAQRGDAQAAAEHLTLAAAQFEQSDLQPQLAQVRALLAEVTDTPTKPSFVEGE